VLAGRFIRPMKSALSLLFLSPTLLLAELKVPHFFSDHMVLQRERSAAIWGKADAGAEVSVSFKNKSATAKAGADGRWKTQIETGAADAKGSVLTIMSGMDQIAIQDVLVGEVWFASGQSNMFYTMNRSPEYAGLIKESNHPGLRMFNAPLVTAVENQDDIDGVWAASTPETVANFSAVAFFFARKLHLELGIPVGVIKSAWGGKPVETFTSREALNTLPGTKALVEAMLKEDAAYDQAKADAAYTAKLEQWKATMAAAKGKSAEERKRLPKKPDAPKRPLLTEGKPGVLYAAMIHPFTGYTLRGAIWYQGEGNARPGAVPYDQTLPLMINDWRKRWAKTGMAIINDVGEANDIHPKNKKDPGERLARWALAKDYGREIIYSGPLFKSSTIKDGTIRVTFDQAGEGLKSRDGGALKRFEIAGADKVWKWADAKIDGMDAVLVSSTEVKSPVAVRFAWAANPEGANLVNSDGLPASVFRTDEWDDVVIPVTTSATDRRVLADEIKALAAERNKHDSKSPEYKELQKKLQPLMEKYKATAPKK
jgi:sialate O-acetylesterase